MKRELTFVPTIKIHPSRIITYNQVLWSPAPPTRERAGIAGKQLVSIFKDGKWVEKRVSVSFLNSSRQGNGVLSTQAKKRLKLAIEYFLHLNRPKTGTSNYNGRKFSSKVTFITLTLPSKQIHTDNEIKAKCLNQFLIEIGKYNYVTNYVWRSEYQENGNIHFHILVNKYICWRDLRYRWNRIINKLGYVDRYQQNQKEWHSEGFKVRTDLLSKWKLEAQKKAYSEGVKFDWRNPNSTDIHSILNISNIKAYLTKYLTKTEQEKKEPIKEDLQEDLKTGRSWGASVLISNIKGAVKEIDSDIENHLRTLEKHYPSIVYKQEYFTIIDISLEALEALKIDSLTHLFYKYLEREFHYNSQLKF
jgi:hypothetical protein